MLVVVCIVIVEEVDIHICILLDTFLEADWIEGKYTWTKILKKTLAYYKIMVITFINTLYTLVLSFFIS